MEQAPVQGQQLDPVEEDMEPQEAHQLQDQKEVLASLADQWAQELMEMALVEQESPSLEQNQESVGPQFQVPQELPLLVVGLYNQVRGQALVVQDFPLEVLVVMPQVGHYLEPNLSNPQVSPEVTRQVKEMEKEVLMEKEVEQVEDRAE